MATIAENLSKLQTIKSDIKTSIQNKGVEVTDDFSTYSAAIDSIETGGGSGGDTPNYSNLVNTVDEAGLRALGWDNESIGYFKDNNLHYEWQNDEYKVSEENKALYGVVDVLNVSSFKDNPDFVYCPKFEIGQKSDMRSLFYDFVYLKSIPYFDMPRVSDMYQTFMNCKMLTTIPKLNTSKVTSMKYMFSNCSSLTTIPELNTSNVTNMNGMFQGCSSLQTVPHFDTSNVTDMGTMFNGCSKLTSLPCFNAANATNLNNVFGFSNITTLTDLGGFKDLKISITSNFLDRVPNLTIESLMNVINNLYDLTGNGVSSKTLKFGQTNLNKLTPEQIAVATDKGWTITA